jgi:hypothetical protein
MAEIVLAYCSSHAPMMSAARDAAPPDQADRFFGALESIRTEAQGRGVQACVVFSNEHFTNFFLENFPQNCIGVGERNWGPTEAWLPIDKVWIPGQPALADHIARHTLKSGFDPAFSHLLELDHGVMTVYHELDPTMRRAYEFGKAVGDAIRSFEGPERVAVVGAGGLSHWIGTPRVGDIEEDFDRWFLDRLEQGRIEELLDLPDEEIELAGNGAHEIRSWLAVAGAAAPGEARTLAYEPVYPWITGMAVTQFDTAGRS